MAQRAQNCVPMPRIAARPAPAATARRRSRRRSKALEKLGLVRDIDLALHLPLRYEDETRIVAASPTLRDGDDGAGRGRRHRSPRRSSGRAASWS